MTKSDRLTTLIAVLLVLASPKESSNEAHYSHSSSERIQLSDGSNEQKNSITYFLRGQSVCRGVFITVFNISRSTFNHHCTEICSTTQFKPYSTKRGQNRKGAMSAQSFVTSGFLSRFSDLNGMTCPRGRGSFDDEPLRVLPSTTTVK